MYFKFTSCLQQSYLVHLIHTYQLIFLGVFLHRFLKPCCLFQFVDENEEDSEEPPEPVVNEIKEEDAIFSKKCKMFYKKDGDFKDKGVGTIHLKPVADQKIQLLVRADTNLGNVLLNILLHPSLPCTRTGKNNILIVCVPNPPIDEKSPDTALPILIRVKTTQDADELHKIITEKKAAL